MPRYAATVVASALQQAVRGLSADQGYAWATGGLAGLQQQLQDEADMKLPEVLRPQPKWCVCWTLMHPMRLLR